MFTFLMETAYWPVFNPTGGSMLSGNLDQQLLLALNSLAGSDTYPIWKLANNALFRGFPIFFSLVALWFVRDCNKQRSRMLTGLFAVCVATVLSVWLQFHLDIHTRPLLDQALHLKVANPFWTNPIWTRGWADRRASFPSDTATLFFGLATVILLENRLAGVLCFLWVIVIIAIPRVVFGWHYPSDIIGSAVLGPGCVLLFTQVPYLRVGIERVLTLFESRMYFVHALLFVFLAEASNVFESLEEIGKYLAKVLH
jgi:undecaprenyl-diphosphatase